MDDDFEIELQEARREAESQIQLPANILALGEIDMDDVRVYIKQDVYNALERYAASDTSIELGTILLGDYRDGSGRTEVIISNYIEAKYTDASASTLTFTHETWNYVYQQHDKRYPNTKIIGWQHTHPSYGIFLSNYDLFIQENFFSAPFQIAYVIDPVQKLRGFFQWKNGKIEKLKGFYIYDDVGKPIKTRQEKGERSPGTDAEKHRPSAFLTGLLILSFLCTAILGGAALWMGRQLHTQQERCAALEQTVAAQQKELTHLAGQQAIAAQAPSEPTPPPSETTQDRPASPDADTVTFTRYEVQPGDTLTGICADHGIDPSTEVRMILAVNGITDANKIYAGQTLLLPMPMG